MKRLELISEGKSKRIYATDDPRLVIESYKDETTAFNGLKRGNISGKGVINNRISNHLMTMLEKNGIPTHFVEELGERETLVRRVTPIPLRVVVRNITAGSMAKRLGLPEGQKLRRAVVEIDFKDEMLEHPMVNEDYIYAMGWASEEQVKLIKQYSRRINELLCTVMRQAEIEVIDCKLEFGVTVDGTLVLADEISPDTCRLWDASTHEKLGIDRFRRNLGDVEQAYQEVWSRLMGERA